MKAEQEIYLNSDLVDIVARNQGRLLSELPDSNAASTLSFARNLVNEDPEFSQKVKNRLIDLRSEVLFSRLPNFKKAKQVALPMTVEGRSSFSPSPQPNPNMVEDMMARKNHYDRRLRHNLDPRLQEEIKIKRKELRNIIGLPVQKNQTPARKILVKQTYTLDVFGIFRDFTSQFPPENLFQRIPEVKTIIDTIMSTPTTKENHKAKRLYYEKAKSDYFKKWF